MDKGLHNVGGNDNSLWLSLVCEGEAWERVERPAAGACRPFSAHLKGQEDFVTVVKEGF